eukprot:scaffold1478_cov185-Pinguiococcus_pyrenoidosus.AAC.1
MERGREGIFSCSQDPAKNSVRRTSANRVTPSASLTNHVLRIVLAETCRAWFGNGAAGRFDDKSRSQSGP